MQVAIGATLPLMSSFGTHNSPIASARVIASSLALATILTGCASHHITSSPSGAEVYMFPRSGEQPEPWQLGKPYLHIQIKSPKTPFAYTGGPFAHWYQVRKEGYLDSDLVYLPDAFPSFSSKSHHFTLQPAEPVTRATTEKADLKVRDRASAVNAIRRALSLSSGSRKPRNLRFDIDGFYYATHIHSRSQWVASSGLTIVTRDYTMPLTIRYKAVCGLKHSEFPGGDGRTVQKVEVFQRGPRTRILDLSNKATGSTTPHHVIAQPIVLFFPPGHNADKENFAAAMNYLCPGLSAQEMTVLEDYYLHAGEEDKNTPLSEDQVRGLCTVLQPYVSSRTDLYVAPDIPDDRLTSLRNSCELGHDEKIIAGVHGSGGLVFTTKEIRFQDLPYKGPLHRWPYIAFVSADVDIREFGKFISIGGGLHFKGDAKRRSTVLKLLVEAQDYLRKHVNTPE